MRDTAIRRLAVAGVLAAAIVLLTALVSIPMPGGHGYINLGDAGVLTAGFVLGGPWGALCAGAASALSDVLLGWSVYAPATFLIKGLTALVSALLLGGAPKKARLLLVYPAALVVPVGYFLFETVLYGAATAAPNVLFNTVQCLVGAALAHGVVAVLTRRGLAGPKTDPAQPAGTILREPKGGPDVVLAASAEQTDVIYRAADILSVQGFTARLVQLAPGVRYARLGDAARAELFAENVPLISLPDDDALRAVTPADLAKLALKEIRK